MPWLLVIERIVQRSQLMPAAVPAGETVYSTAAKRQKTEKRKEPPPAVADEPWSLHERQPWADKEVAPAVLNEEQKAR